MTGTVRAVCVSPSTGGRKEPVAAALMVAGHGIEGDAHAGDWHRQISLLDERDIDGMRSEGLELEPGDFGENLVLAGVDLVDLGVGSRLGVGGVELEITQIGKVCHSRCAIYAQTGDCIMPRRGVFARVLGGGEVRPGDPVEVRQVVPRAALQAGVVTVSDSAAAGVAGDTAGPAVADLLARELEAHVAWAGVVPDDEGAISELLGELVGRGLDLVVTCGGTGCAARDRTPEATRAVIEREVPGLAEAMRVSSALITPRAWLQRGIAGIAGSTLIVNLPGSRKAATENLQAVVGVLAHAVAMLRGHTAHPESDAERGRPPAASHG